MAELELEIKRMIVKCLALEGITPEEIDSHEPLFGEGLGLARFNRRAGTRHGAAESLRGQDRVRERRRARHFRKRTQPGSLHCSAKSDLLIAAEASHDLQK